MAWTYILECADGSLYVGSTVHLDRRVSEHQFGLGAAYTRPRRRRPVRLVWSVELPDVEQAMATASRLRRWSRARRLALVEGRLPMPEATGREPASG